MSEPYDDGQWLRDRIRILKMDGRRPEVVMDDGYPVEVISECPNTDCEDGLVPGLTPDGMETASDLCPYCKGKFSYHNCQIDNPKDYGVSRYCRTCSSFFYIVSPVYKLHVKYYDKLELLREGYISIRDKLREIQSKK